MGGNSASTPELTQAFAQNTGYQQPNQVAPITQPHLQTPIQPTPEQAAHATQQRMQQRSPMAAPTNAPQKFGSWVHDPIKTMPGYKSR